MKISEPGNTNRTGIKVRKRMKNILVLEQIPLRPTMLKKKKKENEFFYKA